MKTRSLARIAALPALAALALSLPLRAGHAGFDMQVLVDGVPRPELHGRGGIYVEALRGRPYSIRLTNPLGVRVAVALAVDGRNTIDAKRTSAWDAAKWVLDPYASVVISGWQVDGATARRFTFTTEKRSYAAWLGDASNLGVIEAVFYRERTPPPPPPRPIYQEREEDAASGFGAAAPPAPEPRASERQASRDRAQSKAEALSDAAATGMGDATAHEVTSVHLDLETRPVARQRIRYEYRDQLVSLGILPREEPPMHRRERATGFSSYCPQPD